jgi:alkanesulfonate monooxygenase SsuD/methylene tetrahydromethanopterin reductase-like flavin-dependent oxidoreductase (luciferase family)
MALYVVRRAKCAKPHIPLLIGGGGEKVTLKLVAQYADACNVGHLDSEGLKHKFAILKQHCDAVGRDYESIKRTLEFICVIAPTEEEARAKAHASPSLGPDPSIEQLQKQELYGTPEMIRRRLAEVEEAGVQEVIIFLPDAKDLESIKLFARECIVR